LAGLASLRGRVLTVGDGDLSFSLGLAQALHAETGTSRGGRDLGGVSLVATTHLSRADLDLAYGAAATAARVAALAACGADVLHGVDATTLDKDPRLMGHAFDRVVWNFPCVAGTLSRDADAQLAEIAANQALLKAFFKACSSGILRAAPAAAVAAGAPEGGATGDNGVGSSSGLGGGEVHVAHKAKAPFGHWGIEQCAAEGSGGALAYCGAVVFDRACFPGYGARKVHSGSGSFPTSDALVYVWQSTQQSSSSSSEVSRVPATITSSHHVSSSRTGAASAEGSVDVSALPLVAQLRFAAQNSGPRGRGAVGAAGAAAPRRPHLRKPNAAPSFAPGVASGAPALEPLAPGGPQLLRLSEEFLDSVCAALCVP
jgi:hypothetical protein